MTRISSRPRLPPACRTTICPTQVVTPAASSASATTNTPAIRMTGGLANPANASSSVPTSVAHSASATPSATMPTASRYQTNTATETARLVRMIAPSLLAPAFPAPGHLNLHRVTRAERDANEEPGDEEDDPQDAHDHRVREHQGDDGADPRIPPVPLRDQHDEGEIHHQRRERIDGRIADPVRRQERLGRDVEPDEDRDKDRGEDR